NADFDPGTQIPLQIYDPKTGKYSNTDFTAIVDNSGRTASAAVTHFTQFVASTSTSNLIQISSITPTTVSLGDKITITGSGFTTKMNQDVVKFAGTGGTSVQAVVQSATASTITATVPTGAVTGAVTVRVGNKTSNGVTVTVNSSNPPPGTISISPATATAG